MAASSRPRAGRPPGSPPNREAILAAARDHFARHGYDRATIRGIAVDAAVDPALIYHYFGSKAELLVAALALPHDPRENVARTLSGGTAGLGERILREFLGAWDSDRGTLMGLFRSAASHEDAARILCEFFLSEFAHRVAQAAARPQPELRAALVFSELTGLAMARFVLRVEPIASADVATLVACVTPTLDRYLTGPLT
jgi:AcrR family transcriptional regulator